MLPYKKSVSIADVQFDEIISYSKDVERFTEIGKVNPIPSNSIIYKTVTGIGATHSEIVSKRHSIIVFPHISIIISKHEYYKAQGIITQPIYGDIGRDDIAKYLDSDNEYAKILTTPKGVAKLIKLMELAQGTYPEMQYQKLFFLLIDECHKLIQDADYRTDMLEVMEQFFDFENKAMVSATPIPPSDPRFLTQKFKHIKVTPDFNYIQDIELIHANALVNGLQEYLDKNEANRHCFFFNSVEGIKSLISQLNIKDDYQIFCSQDSHNILKIAKELKVNWKIGPLSKYNFFTSSFYNGLDITEGKPNIVILTDYGYRDHTLLDPYTDILQIIGRFRKKNNGEKGYSKIVHINNSSHFTTPVSADEAILRVDQSASVYNHIEDLRESLANPELFDLFNQALSTVKPYEKG
ncbi:MAG TPA: hypothetical protein VK668_10365 [Mucilaginibacter sp.]|nr:hypothetical protein [Mucilaginibacter sp.]